MKPKKINSPLALALQITLAITLILGSAILMASTLKSAQRSSSQGAGPASSSVFANVTGPIGVAAAPGLLIVSEYCTGNLDQIDDLGNVSLFTSIPGYPAGCNEMYLAISPGLGTWAPNDIYSTLGDKIFKIPPSGSPVTLFATLPSGCGPDRTGITFDHVGTFDNDMIATCLSGAVWRVNSAGVPTFVASTNTQLEGPAIPPLSFGPVGGQILAADEVSGNVWAISNAGVVTTPFSYPSAESVHVIPPNACSFGNSDGALFSAMFGDNQIWKWPPSDLSGLGGNVLVTSEFGSGIGLVTFNGSSYVISQFSPETDQHEGSAIVDCEVGPSPTPTPTPTVTPTTCGNSFVIGDLDAVVGNKVTFWGAQWWRKNHLSAGSAPASFKGFANCTNPNPPACGGTWQSDPGNSSHPPDTVPADMTVIVSSSITKSGAIESGDIPMMVTIHTDPGYGPNPGHEGTGTVTAVVCQGGRPQQPPRRHRPARPLR
jgi:hypothetical protein